MEREIRSSSRSAFWSGLRSCMTSAGVSPRGWLHDSGALAPFAFAVVALAGMAICAYVGVRSGWVMPLMIVTAVCALLFVGLTCLSLGVYRRHAAEPMRRDLFAMGGVLFSISWMDDGKAYGSSGKGIVRIHVIPLDRVRAYRNKEDRTVWILPQHAGDLRDIWRRGIAGRSVVSFAASFLPAACDRLARRTPSSASTRSSRTS